ncbi:MAG TPA: hypothetical protein VMW50_04705, partial [Dehalococcoidia bacterium]|nr:hypothetical protein [Dehalococcoidia bacterium]
MPIEHIFNLEPGYDVRQKLNAAIDIVNNTGSTPQDLLDHIADHNSHTNIGPDDHHPQLHD